MQKKGSLFIVATPIGNLADISFRAIAVLKSVDLIAAEDTRHSQRLLQEYHIKTPLISYHAFNEQKRLDVLRERLAQSQNVALISDAGTPLISDPGYALVKHLQGEGFKVVPIPGCSAVITALCASGLPTDRFIFEGFLSAKPSGAKKELHALVNETRTMIFYEAPHRIVKLINLMREVFGDDRLAVIARELTKTFETIKLATLKELSEFIANDSNQEKGEFVVLVHGKEKSTEALVTDLQKKMVSELLAEFPLKQAVDLTVKITDGKRKHIYDYALSIAKK